MMVTDLLPGETLQAWALRFEGDLKFASGLLAEAIDQMHRCTDRAYESASLEAIPKRSLADDFHGVLTGMVDFEKAAFVDPLAVLARYPVYDLQPIWGSKFAERVLAHLGYTAEEFAPRVAVLCLRTLQTKVPASIRNDRSKFVLTTFKTALAQMQ
jgi:hypothetical protein